MVPSGPTTVELWMSGVVMVAWSAGLSDGLVRSMLRWRFRLRGPVCGLRPVCRASIWYIGLPATTAGAGDGLATGGGPGAGLAAGDAAAATDGEATRPGD